LTFLHPMMLWSFAALLPLAALYFLKVRPRRKPTTAFFLWEKALEERRANSLFKRLRDFWSLLLMLVACSAVCLALAQPEWNDRRQDLLILLDASASMAAKEGGTARIEMAKRAAAEIVEGLNGVQRAAVATVAQNIVYRSHLTDNPGELLDTIQTISASNQPLRFEAFSGLEDSQNRFLREHRVVLISDGCFGGKTLPKQVELVKIGKSLENAGIVAADMAYLPTGTNRLAFYCQVASSFAAPREVDLMVARIDEQGVEQLAKVIPLEIKPGLNRPETYTLENALPGKWIARLNGEDALSLDNTAHLAAALPDVIRVGVNSEDRYFLEKSVLAFSQSAGLLTLVRDKPDVVLANASVPAGEKLLLFHPAGESIWWKDLGETIDVVEPRVMTKNHPALRHLDAAALPFVGAKRLNAPPGAQILVADDRGVPLIYAARRDRSAAIVVNMDPVAADFYFSAWFPVLVHSAATYLAGRENSLSATYRPGDVVPIPGALEETASTFTTLVGEKNIDKEVRGKYLSLGDRLGYAELKNASGQWFVGSSLLAESETLLDHQAAAGVGEALSRGRSPTWWLALLAIGVLTVESVLYHRRKVG
jgi:hypothetical protein